MSDTASAVAGQEKREQPPLGGLSSVLFKYQDEFLVTYDGLRKRSTSVKEDMHTYLATVRKQLEPQKKQLFSTFQDLSDVRVPSQVVVNTFAWAAVLVLGASIMSVVGAYLLSPILSLFLGTFTTLLIVHILLPLFAAYMLKVDEESNQSDETIRFRLLGLALVLGMLHGFLLSNLHIASQPLAAITPSVIAIAAELSSTLAGKERVKWLGMTAGCALGVQLLVGVATGLMSFAYFVLALGYSAVALITLQFVYRGGDSKWTHAEQLGVLLGFLFTKSVVFAVLGTHATTFGEQHFEQAQY